MESSRPSLAFDLLRTDLEDPGSLADFIVAHTISPARAAYGLPAPQPNEAQSYFVERTETTADGLRIQHWRSYHLDESTQWFDPLVRGLLLFAWLFPDCFGYLGSAQAILEHPGTAVLSDSTHLVARPHEAVVDLVAGLLGTPRTRPFWTGGLHSASRNDDALTELREAKQLVSAYLAHVEEDPHTHVIDIGLRRMEWAVSNELDDTLRSDVRRRLVSLAKAEFYDDESDSGEVLGTTTWIDRGVITAEVPESIKGLVALDLSEQLGRDRTTGRCAHCHGLLRLNARQTGRARRGDPVYHADCRDEHRLGYFRDKSKVRYARVKGAARASEVGVAP